MATTSRSTYVLDTSVLLSDPRAIFRFKEHEVVFPVVVVTWAASRFFAGGEAAAPAAAGPRPDDDAPRWAVPGRPGAAPGLPLALGGQVDVDPPGEEVLGVPFAFTVPQQHQGPSHGSHTAAPSGTPIGGAATSPKKIAGGGGRRPSP